MLLVLAVPGSCYGTAGRAMSAAAETVSIGAVQGRVDDAARADSFVSPMQGQTVVVRGVVTQKIVQPRPGRDALHGLFVQNARDDADGDPTTSDGIYVYLGGKDRIRTDDGSYTDIRVGDEVVLRGRVEEQYYMTQLQRPTLVLRLRRDVDLKKKVAIIDLELPADARAAARLLERVEGMQVRVPKGAIACGGRGSYDEIHLAMPDRNFIGDDPYAHRVFRDPHPCDNRPAELFDDGNGDRIVLGGFGLQHESGGGEPTLPAVRTFDVLAEPVRGGLYYSYGKFLVHVSSTPRFRSGPDPAANHAPAAPDRTGEVSIAVYNVENLYDLRDDPTDGNDHPGDPGEGGIRKPFNYLPGSMEEYSTRVRALAEQILTSMHAPDILMLQEVEDQDMLTRRGAKLGAADGGDGRPDVLQDLAIAIEEAGGPPYRAALDRDGADVRGIVCGYLFRADRVRMPTPASDDPVLRVSPGVAFGGAPHAMNRDSGNPRALNFSRPEMDDADGEGSGRNVFSRAPQVGRFEIFRERLDEGEPLVLYLVNNHFSSRPTDRVAQRKMQAAASAAIGRAILAKDPAALVGIGGDLNVYPRPDDPFAPGDAQFPSDQLAALYEAGLASLYDGMLRDAPAAAYTYVYQGQAQTLDHLFVSAALLERVVEARAAHVNCDWPADHDGDGPRGLSDHDPLVVRIRGW